VPRGVGALIESRVARLGDDSRAILDAAAVAGREFELAVLERVVGGDPLPAIERAIRARLVEEEPGAIGRFSFSHALFRQSIYEQLTPSRRIRMHARIADAISDLGEWEPGARLGDLAHHTYMAARDGSVGAARTALPYSVRAGDAASESGAFEEAVGHYRRAAELMEMAGTPDHDRMDVLLKTSEHGSRVGLWAEMRKAAHTAAAIARTSGSADELARSALSMFGGVFVDPMQVRTEDRTLLEEAIDSLPEEDSTARSQLLTWRCWLMYSDPRSTADRWPEIAADSEEALAMARRLGDPRTLAFAALYYAGARLDPAFTPDLVEKAREAVALARESGWVDLLGHALEFYVTALVKAGDLDPADAPIAEVEELGRFAPIHAWMGTSSRLSIAVLRGRLDDADRYAALGTEQLERGRSQSLLFSHFSGVVELRRQQGRLDEVLPILDGFTNMAPKVAYIRAVLASALAEVWRLALVREHWDLLVEEGLEKMCGSFLFGRNASAYLASICHALGDADHARTMYEILLPQSDIHLSDGRPPAGCHGYGAHYLGMLAGLLGRSEDAERHFTRALELHTAMGSPSWIAETRYRLAEMLMAKASPDLERAGRLLGEARALAEAHDLAGQLIPISAFERQLESRG
jgi:tetratricopeptide (TPR) repeat protein